MNAPVWVPLTSTFIWFDHILLSPHANVFPHKVPKFLAWCMLSFGLILRRCGKISHLSACASTALLRMRSSGMPLGSTIFAGKMPWWEWCFACTCHEWIIGNKVSYQTFWAVFSVLHFFPKIDIVLYLFVSEFIWAIHDYPSPLYRFSVGKHFSSPGPSNEPSLRPSTTRAAA